MVTSVYTHDQNRGNTATAQSLQIPEDKFSDIQFRLTTMLQTTLELEPLLDLFFGQLQHLLKLQSLVFQNNYQHLNIQLGVKAKHSTDYNLTVQQQELGNIVFTRKQRFSNGELEQLESLLGTLVYPLRNALNYREAIQRAHSDPLTGLGNRSALENAIEHQWQMSRRYDQDFSVLVIDIDYFKKVNDNFGHDIGDMVLKEVAVTIDATTRQTDLTFRYGGEEFVVLLSKTGDVGAHVIAERIRENVQNLSVTANNSHRDTLHVTVSIGLSHLQPEDDAKTLFKQADQALYKAKSQGRNQVVIYQNAY